MHHGRAAGVALALGIIFIWSMTAAFGVGAILLTHVWILESVRYCGAAYLLYLGCKSLRSAIGRAGSAQTIALAAPRGHFLAGLMLHLTNPKPILFFGTLFTIGVPAGTGMTELAFVVLVVGLNNAAIFLGYALLFSNAAMARAYAGARRLFESVFAVLFGIAGIRILMMRFTP